jgi:hypothetical protein
MSNPSELSLFRVYVLRATYLLVAIGLGIEIWPLILQSASAPPEHMKGVVRAVLGAVSLLALVGVRYPVRMLPLLLFELLWKTIWVLAIGLPLWRAGRLDAATRETWQACLMGLIIFPLAIPWPYAVRTYLIARGDRWRRHVPHDSAAQPRQGALSGAKSAV